MATATKIRPVTANTKGLAKWLERESQTMHPLQFFREALQNELEAGADKIIIDGYEAPSGHLLTRVSGNGAGMKPEKLISHLATVMITDKGEDNYGVGARIAALPANPAGVTFASKTATTEGVISIIKSDGVYGLRTWTVKAKDEDGEVIAVQEEVIAPSDGELAHINTTGTAVILHGNGKGPTWDSSLSYKVHNYLARRYYQFPGNVVVTVRHPKDVGTRNVIPFGHTLAKIALADGEVPFRDIGGLSGSTFWWLLPTSEMNQGLVSGNNRVRAGIGLVVDNEIFDYSQNYMTDFGIQYRSVQSRVVMLIRVDGAKMDTSRTTVVYPTGRTAYKRQTPWKTLGAYFSEHMPPELDEIMSRVTPSSSIFTEDAAKKLDPEWWKWIKPVPVTISMKEGTPSVGDDSGDALPPGKSHDKAEPGPRPENPQPRIAAHRQNSGQKPGVTKLKTVTPQVEFVAPEEMPEGHPHIYWAETSNKIMISGDFPPYVREVKRWIEKTDHPRSLVESAVKQAYSIEYAAYIVDSNAQRAAQLVPADIEQLKSDLSLYGKALGCQSLSEMIAQYLKTAIKSS